VSTTEEGAGASYVVDRASASNKKHLQTVWRIEHLRAQPKKEQVKAMRRIEYLRAQPHKKHLQTERRSKHL
jgi:hypothetical protein